MTTEPQKNLKEEFDFRDLVRKPEKLFGYLYLYFFGALLLLGLYYGWHLSDVGKNSVPPAAFRDSSAYVRDIPFQAARVIPPVDVMKVGVPSDNLLSRGRALYQANCASCHGDDGRGDGPAGLMMNPRPRDFSSTEGWKKGAKVSQIYETLEEGILKSGMPSFNHMPPYDRFALAHTVRTFYPSPPIDTDADLQELETTYQLSKGMVMPARIPVRKATAILMTDARPMMSELEIARSMFDAERGDEGARILRTLVRNEEEMLVCLVIREEPTRSLDDFVKVVCSDPESIGIDASITQLTTDQWREVFRYIIRLRRDIQREAGRKGSL